MPVARLDSELGEEPARSTCAVLGPEFGTQEQPANTAVTPTNATLNALLDKRDISWRNSLLMGFA